MPRGLTVSANALVCLPRLLVELHSSGTLSTESQLPPEFDSTQASAGDCYSRKSSLEREKLEHVDLLGAQPSDKWMLRQRHLRKLLQKTRFSALRFLHWGASSDEGHAMPTAKSMDSRAESATRSPVDNFKAFNVSELRTKRRVARDVQADCRTVNERAAIVQGCSR